MSTSRWSPITSFPKQALTPSGLLALDTSDDEVEICTRSNVELRSLTPMISDNNTNTNRSNNSNTWHDRDMDLTATLTTHKIVFQTSNTSSSTSTSTFLHLSNLQSHSTTGGDWFSNQSYKIIIQTLTHGNFYIIFRSSHGKEDRDFFYKRLEKAYSRKQWEEASRLHIRSSSSDIGNNNGNTAGGGYSTMSTMPASTGVGVAAIVNRNRLKHEHNAKLANQAFNTNNNNNKHASNSNSKATKKEREQEVETLMREAKELTNVIHKYVATLEKNAKQNNNNNNNDDNDNDNEELTSMLSHMGMITAIPSKIQSSSTSSKSSTTIYYETLARQISDFLLTNKSFSISKGGNGIMTLTDVYCLFNRARGANMISPEDLMLALGRMEDIGLGMKVREFDNGSGVSVLQETGFDDRVIVKKIVDYVENVGKVKNGRSGGRSGGKYGGRMVVGVTALEAGRILKISPLLAKEQLLSAEQNGYLCRDVTMEGTRFFCNLFLSHF